MTAILSKFAAYFRDTVNEIKNLHFPSKQEVYITTIVIVCVITVASLTILLADFVISKIIGLLFGL